MTIICHIYHNMTDYKIRAYDAAGTLQYELVDFQSLSYRKAVNEAGLGKFVLNGEHPLVTDIEDKWQIEFWRRNQGQGIDWACDFYGLFREPDREGAGPGTFTALCPGQLSILGWPIVAWPAGTANRSQFNAVPAETIMKTLVDYNAGGNATAGNGRVRTWAINGWTIGIIADSGGGNVLDWYCAYDNLLATLQDIGSVAGGDFDLVQIDTNKWEFRWYDGQLGTDRTTTVMFAVELGNMARPRFRQRRLNERTVAIVAGQGEGSERDIAVRTGGNYSTTNEIEMLVDARNVAAGNSGGLNTRGDQALFEKRATDEFDFDVLQVPSTLYGLHYFLGDLVTVRSPYTGSDVTRKIRAVTVGVDTNGEQIGVEMVDV